jgi:transposase
MPDEETETRRYVSAEGTQLVTKMTCFKNKVHSVVHAHLIPPYQGSLFPKRRRAWLEALLLAEDQRRVFLHHVGELDRLGADLAELDKSLTQKALDDPQVRWLMTITGVNATAATSVLAAIGDIKGLSIATKARELFRFQSKGATVGRQAHLSWTHQQAGTGPCPFDAGRGSLDDFRLTRPATGFLRAHQE